MFWYGLFADYEEMKSMGLWRYDLSDQNPGQILVKLFEVQDSKGELKRPTGLKMGFQRPPEGEKEYINKMKYSLDDGNRWDM